MPEALVPLLIVIPIAFALAMDAFAVSVAVGVALERMGTRHVIRLACYFGFFQFMMPVVGWAAGTKLTDFVFGFENWLTFGLLTLIGANMIMDARREQQMWDDRDPTRGMLVLMLALATSIDALGVGFIIAAQGARAPAGGINIWFASVVIGIVAAVMTAIGMLGARHVSKRMNLRAELLGGSILIAVAAVALVMAVRDSLVLLRHYFPGA